MICQGYDERLSDYVDGTLPDDGRARFQAHLAQCSHCRAALDDLQTIRSLARSLEPHLPPPHVWRNIAEASRASSRWSSLRALFITWQPAAATAMAVVISVGLWWVADRLSVVAPGSAGRPMSTHTALAGSPYLPEVHYTSAIASLEELTGEQRTALDPEMVAVLDSGMTVIDAAIDQSRAALAAQPDSDVAQESLFQALRSKVSLLQDTLTLVNGMRDVGVIGEAPITTERTP